MGKQIPISTTFNLPDGTPVTIETGKLASLAHGSAVVRIGKTMLFASVVSNHEAREGQPFFPLSVDYQEKFAAVGRIPGNFFRREARLSDYEILTCRLVDRAIRPLFPKGYMNETQVIINLISGEADVLPDAYAALAASAALVVSDINWAGPISECRVARVNGEFIVNPKKSEVANSDLEIIVAATLEDVMMVEGEADECSERDMVEAIRVGHEAIKVMCKAQLALADLVGEKATVKRTLVPAEENEELLEIVESFATDKILTVARGAHNKGDRKDGLKEIKTALKDHVKESKGEEYFDENSHYISGYFDKVMKNTVRRMVLDEGVRLDGRKYDEIRHIWSEVDYLPSAHGSAVFTRGETQSLTSLTLGSAKDAQMIDTALEFSTEKFILHYNFPAYSVGEVRPMRGPGRREVGHANLAGRSIKKVLPPEWPYTMRLVSDILESNGSSSMATVCAGCLALMDAGVPVTNTVSGIAMGMISDGEKTAVLSDILGDEDALGDMDFKVTGTKNGITACQMDIKINGLPYETMIAALEQAKAGRIHIINKMEETMPTSRTEMKEHAPRVETRKIDKSFIGAVIGPGGKIIQELQERTGTTISIDEVDGKGIVQVLSTNATGLKEALAAIDDITFEPQVNDEYDAVVDDIVEFGAFVKFKGKKGLLHISEIAHKRVEKVEDYLKKGDVVKVKLIGLDKRTGKFKLSRKVLLPRD